MLFTIPELTEYISEVIPFDETLRHRTNDGIPMPEALAKQGIIPGTKVDMGSAISQGAHSLVRTRVAGRSEQVVQ
jgi:fructose-bisphosphate aldolase, class I